MKINELPSGWVTVSKLADPNGGEVVLALNHDEQRELLEDLARVQGFTLIDREERKSLVALIEEVDEDANDYDHASEAWGTWQDRCEALAGAVSQALDLVPVIPKEV